MQELGRNGGLSQEVYLPPCGESYWKLKATKSLCNWGLRVNGSGGRGRLSLGSAGRSEPENSSGPLSLAFLKLGILDASSRESTRMNVYSSPLHGPHSHLHSTPSTPHPPPWVNQPDKPQKTQARISGRAAWPPGGIGPGPSQLVLEQWQGGVVTAGFLEDAVSQKIRGIWLDDEMRTEPVLCS